MTDGDGSRETAPRWPHGKLEDLNTIAHVEIVPVFYDPNVEGTTEVATTLVAGGIRTLEFADRGDNALGVLASSSARASDLPQAIVGAGTIVDGGTAGTSSTWCEFRVRAELLVRSCGAPPGRDVAYVPGCATMTESCTAYGAGCDTSALSGSLDRGPCVSRGGPRSVPLGAGDTSWWRRADRGIDSLLVSSRRSGGWHQIEMLANSWWTRGISMVSACWSMPPYAAITESRA